MTQALQLSGRYVEEIQLTSINAIKLRDLPATRHVFTQLTKLELDLVGFEFFAQGAARHENIVNILKCTEATLQHLRLRFAYRTNKPMNLDNIFNECNGNKTDVFEPIVFQKLQTLDISSFEGCGQSLIQFLTAQRMLNAVGLWSVRITTASMTWLDVVACLSRSVCSLNSVTRFMILPLMLFFITILALSVCKKMTAGSRGCRGRIHCHRSWGGSWLIIKLGKIRFIMSTRDSREQVWKYRGENQDVEL